jgi:hypothetical protein
VVEVYWALEGLVSDWEPVPVWVTMTLTMTVMQKAGMVEEGLVGGEGVYHLEEDYLGLLVRLETLSLTAGAQITTLITDKDKILDWEASIHRIHTSRDSTSKELINKRRISNRVHTLKASTRKVVTSRVSMPISPVRTLQISNMGTEEDKGGDKALE